MNPISELELIETKISDALHDMRQWLVEHPDVQTGGFAEGVGGHLQQADELIGSVINGLKARR